ncbi:hypothetical protein GOBAR_AA36324 [Gossypium barbadense]|uniref:Reverse transcriptase zinc-binding domain-containing protein n=1 Tax=Gossypium barbadense TaxID=3634 RepID=A0A2P5VZW8_GOSBA|nr:hypothetical protein GOBAR_AA36324 [Gossypium barbadense]
MLGHFICTTSTGCIDETLRVCDLITFDGSWNWQQLETLLPRPVLDCIAVVLLPSQDASFDKIIWQWSFAGRFPSSRTYKQFVGRRNMSTPADGSMVWKVSAPQRVRLFLWVVTASKESTIYELGESEVWYMTDDAHYVICGENVVRDYCMAKAVNSELNRLLMFEVTPVRAQFVFEDKLHQVSDVIGF